MHSPLIEFASTCAYPVLDAMAFRYSSLQFYEFSVCEFFSLTNGFY